MSYQIPIYAAEREVPGLEDKIRASSSIIYSSQIENVPGAVLTKEAVERFVNYGKAVAGSKDFDLHPLKSILATACWNKNDDVFDAVELWAARKTPEDKPFNYGHNCADIIGHMTSSYAIDDQGVVLADDSTTDSLPAKFHIVTSAVLYKVWSIDVLQERMDTILAEIDEGEWFVSMECLFRGFDYALKSESGECTIVARNDDTAFLTKHLRVYGGTGKYNGQRVGRVMRNIVFCGKGLVKKPANPESIIFAEVESFDKPGTIFEFSNEKNNLGYQSASVNNSETSIEENGTKMADNQIEAKLAEAEKRIKELEGEAKANDSKQKQTEIEALQAQLKTLNETNASLQQKVNVAEAGLAAKTTEVEAAKARITEVEAAQKTAADELAAIQAKASLDARVKLVAEKLSKPKEDAEKFAAALAALSDVDFTEHVTSLAAMLPPKGTPAKTPPKSTSKPAPMAGSHASTKDAAAVGAEVLEGAEAEAVDGLGNADVESEEGTKVQKSIATYFGCEEDDN